MPAGRREGERIEYDDQGRVVGRTLFVADRPVDGPERPAATTAAGETPPARPGWLARLLGEG